MGSLVRRSAVTIPPDASVAEAATLMRDERVSYLVIELGDGRAIVTDHETVTLYCGHYFGDDEGTFSVAVGSSGLALLSATSDDTGPLGVVQGEVQDGEVTFEAGGLTVTGQIAGGTIAGDWHDGSDYGTWAASSHILCLLIGSEAMRSDSWYPFSCSSDVGGALHSAGGLAMTKAW